MAFLKKEFKQGWKDRKVTDTITVFVPQSGIGPVNNMTWNGHFKRNIMFITPWQIHCLHYECVS